MVYRVPVRHILIRLFITVPKAFNYFSIAFADAALLELIAGIRI